MMKILFIIPVLFLGGCETILANAIQDYHDSREIIRSYIGENVNDRRWVRQQCRDNLTLKVAQLRADDKPDDANTLLIDAYPPALLDENSPGFAASINHPHICGAKEDGNTNTEPGA